MNSPDGTARDQIPIRDKSVYALSASVQWVVSSVPAILWFPVLNLGFGLEPEVAGTILMALRLFDAVADPVMGNITDNTRTRWGRRRPYIVIGGILTGIAFAAVWWVDPSWSQTGKIWYLGLAGLLLYACFTSWAMPHDALGMELTSDYRERTKLAGFLSFTNTAIGMGGAWLLWSVTEIGSVGAEMGPDGEPVIDYSFGVRVVAVLVGLYIVMVAPLSGFFVKEKSYRATVARQETEGLLRSIGSTVQCWPMWCVSGVLFLNLVGLMSVIGLGQYVNIFFVNEGSQSSGAFFEGIKGTITPLITLMSIPFWVWFSNRTDKKLAMAISILAACFGHLLNLYCLRAGMPWLQLIPSVFYGAVSSSIWLIAPAMKLDVTGYDQRSTGKRREGSLSAMYAWVLKLGVTLGLFLSGYLLSWTGFDSELGGDQPDHVLDSMKFTYVLFPICCWAVSLVLVWLYPLSKRRVAEIREELSAQRERTSPPSEPKG